MFSVIVMFSSVVSLGFV